MQPQVRDSGAARHGTAGTGGGWTGQRSGAWHGQHRRAMVHAWVMGEGRVRLPRTRPVPLGPPEHHQAHLDLGHDPVVAGRHDAGGHLSDANGDGLALGGHQHHLQPGRGTGECSTEPQAAIRTEGRKGSRTHVAPQNPHSPSPQHPTIHWPCLPTGALQGRHLPAPTPAS